MIEIKEYKDELQRCVLKISGTGAINDYEDVRQRPWDNNRYEFNRIIVEDGITRIGKNAFIDCPNVMSISLPNSLVSIGENAFRGCWMIDTLVIPDNVTTIEKYAFGGCERLSEITISDNVTFIGEYAFAGFNYLSKIKLPKKLTSIEPSTFYFCVNLKEVIIPDSVTIIKANAFKDCEKLQEIAIPNSVKAIEDQAFYSCKNLKKAIIPNSVSCVGKSVFAGCSKLSAIDIANPNLKFGKNVFGEKAKDFPKALTAKVNDIIQHLDISDICKYGSTLELLDSTKQAEILLSCSPQDLKYYKTLKIDWINVFKYIPQLITSKASSKACTNIANLMVDFCDIISNEIVLEIYQKLQPIKNSKKAIQIIEESSSLMEKI